MRPKASLLLFRRPGGPGPGRCLLLARPGRETLKAIRAHSGEHHKKIAQYRQVITAIFGEHIRPETSLLFEIKTLLDGVPREKEPEAMKILRRCRDNLKKSVNRT